MTASIRTRFAPSPTGYLHIGGLRTALFSWLYARHHQGKFILRIEDTDQARSSIESVNLIIEGMRWLGLNFDEDIHYQSRRYQRYRDIIRTLIDQGKAYYCMCSKQTIDIMRTAALARGDKPRYDRRCRYKDYRPHDGEEMVVRFKTPMDGEMAVQDYIQGTVVYQNAELDDLIIARADGTPTYNLTAVVDDMDMRISHVIRGDDHLNNTPRQINILHALGADIPNYAHLPLVLDEHGKRLSKRHGAADVLQYREDGYLPEALLNYLARLGWSHGDQEILSMAEMVDYFDIKDVNKAATAINPKKLLWLNQHYIKTGDNARIARELTGILKRLGIDVQGNTEIMQLVDVQKQRVKTLLEMAEQSRYFYADFDAYDPIAGDKHLRADVLPQLNKLRNRLAGAGVWSAEDLQQIIIDTAGEFDVKIGKISQPLRVAVTGGCISPPIDATLQLLGKKRTIERLDRALAYIMSADHSW